MDIETGNYILERISLATYDEPVKVRELISLVKQRFGITLTDIDVRKFIRAKCYDKTQPAMIASKDGSNGGYYTPNSIEQIERYVERIERHAKSEIVRAKFTRKKWLGNNKDYPLFAVERTSLEVA